MKGPRTPRRHLWLSPDDPQARRIHTQVRPVLLTRARLAGEIDTSALAHVVVTGWLMQCGSCGIVAMRATYVDDHGDVREISVFGLDVESMAPMREPPCLSLEMPARPLDEDDDDNALTEACA